MHIPEPLVPPALAGNIGGLEADSDLLLKRPFTPLDALLLILSTEFPAFLLDLGS